MEKLSDEIAPNLSTTGSSPVLVVLWLRPGGLSLIRVLYRAEWQSWERHLEPKRMREVVRFLARLVSFFEKN